MTTQSQRQPGQSSTQQSHKPAPFSRAYLGRRQFVLVAGATALAFSTTGNTWSEDYSTKFKEKEMEIKRNGSQPSQVGPSDWFTGQTRIDPLFAAHEPARAAGASVTFEPGARTAWHTHPLGQTLIVTSGVGRVQVWGEPMVEIRPGDVVWFPPGVKHWHGAAPDKGMTHIAIQEAQDGKVVEWLEHVTDQQYEK